MISAGDSLFRINDEFSRQPRQGRDSIAQGTNLSVAAQPWVTCSHRMDSPTGARFLVGTFPSRRSCHSICCTSSSTPSQVFILVTRHEIERDERCIWDSGISARWAFTSFSLGNPGHRSARPGLSNLAPLGLPCSAEDFMFRMTDAEFSDLRSQFGTSSAWGGRRYRPYASTRFGN